MRSKKCEAIQEKSAASAFNLIKKWLSPGHLEAHLAKSLPGLSMRFEVGDNLGAAPVREQERLATASSTGLIFENRFCNSM